MSDRKFYDFITPHDLMRYLMPGITLLFCIFLFELWAEKLFTGTSCKYHTMLISASRLIKKFFGLNPEKCTWMHLLLFLIIALIVAYITGHIISTFSSFLIDRVLIAKGWGYPYIHILGIENNKESFFSPQYIFFYFNFAIIMVYFFSPMMILSYYSGIEKPYLISIIVTILLYILLLPLFYYLLHLHLKRLKMDDESFLQPYKASFKNEFKYNSDKAGTNNFWLPYLFLKSKEKILGENVVSWRRLIIFVRNLATAFYISFLYGFFWFSFHLFLWSQPTIDNLIGYQKAILWLIPFAYFAAFMIMLWRYIYLNGSYFTKLVFRAFVLSCDRNSYDILDY